MQILNSLNAVKQHYNANAASQLLNSIRTSEERPQITKDAAIRVAQFCFSSMSTHIKIYKSKNETIDLYDLFSIATN